MANNVILTNDRFEEYGVELQQTAKDMKQTMQRFDQSCIRCTLYHRQADCDVCPIRTAMLSNVKMHGYPTVDYPWVQEEIKELH